jgi:hypothetical protein
VTFLTFAQAGPSYETIGPGFAGFLVIFALAVATVLLLRSMVGHLRKVRYGSVPDGGSAPQGEAEPAEPARQDGETPPREAPRAEG